MTAVWALPFAVYNVFLLSRIMFYRVKTKTIVGNQVKNQELETDPVRKRYCSFYAYLRFGG